MDIYYTNETLYVKLKDINTRTMNIMQKRVLRIVDDYDIDNIVVKVPSPLDATNDLFASFVNAYRKKHNGNLKIL